MKIQIATISYNERRCGKPWIAKVKFVGTEAKFTFGNWVGERGSSGILIIDVEPGDIIARGQKDNRKPQNSAPDYYIVQDNAKSIAEHHIRAMHEAGFSSVSKKDAYLHWDAQQPQEKAETETDDRPMYTYQIKGHVNYNAAETEDGNLTVAIDETIEVYDLCAESALRAFFAENEQYDDFFDLKTCDQETRGKKGASFTDRTDNYRRLDVDLIEA